MVNEIDSIEEYLKIIFKTKEEMDEYNNQRGLYVHKGLALRGQKSKNEELMPCIGRGRESSCEISILNQEKNLIEMAKHKLPHIFKSDLSPINLLAMLQHYGIPTRLLDVTSNPFVALYFASLDDMMDGEVIAFEYNDGDQMEYPLINAIAESYKFSFSTHKPLSVFYETVVMQSYFIEHSNILSHDTNEDGGLWIKKCCEDIIFVNAMEQLERQKIQQGFYILFPNKIIIEDSILYFDKIISPIKKDHKQIKNRIIIKKEGKKNIQEKLRFLGISEATLFADNIDIVCKNIVEQCKRNIKRENGCNAIKDIDVSKLL